jgi:hypothetical protein
MYVEVEPVMVPEEPFGVRYRKFVQSRREVEERPNETFEIEVATEPKSPHVRSVICWKSIFERHRFIEEAFSSIIRDDAEIKDVRISGAYWNTSKGNECFMLQGEK